MVGFFFFFNFSLGFSIFSRCAFFSKEKNSSYFFLALFFSFVWGLYNFFQDIARSPRINLIIITSNISKRFTKNIFQKNLINIDILFIATKNIFFFFSKSSLFFLFFTNIKKFSGVKNFCCLFARLLVLK